MFICSLCILVASGFNYTLFGCCFVSSCEKVGTGLGTNGGGGGFIHVGVRVFSKV